MVYDPKKGTHFIPGTGGKVITQSVSPSAGLLKQGSQGEEVRKLQESLKAQGFDPGAADAIFGPKTAAAVEAFQKAKGLTVDALVGPKTMGALYPTESAFSPETYAKEKGYSKYFSKGGQWYGNVAGDWQTFKSKTEARSANLGGAEVPSELTKRLEDIKEQVAGVTEEVQKYKKKTTGGIPVGKLGGEGELVIPETKSFQDITPVAFKANQQLKGLTASIQTMLDDQKKLYEEQKTKLDKLEKEREVERKKQKGLVEEAKDWWEERKSTTEIIAEEFERYGLPKSFEHIQELTPQLYAFDQQLIGLETIEAQELLEAGAAGMPQVWIDGRRAKIQQAYGIQKIAISAQKGALASQIAALQGNVNMAQQLASATVNAAVADQEREYNNYLTYMNLNSDYISGLDQEYKNILTSTLNIKENEYTRLLTEKTNIMDLVLQKPEAFTGMDILSLTLENAVQAVADYKEPVKEDMLSVSEAKALGVPYGTTKSQAQAMGITIKPELTTAEQKFADEDWLDEVKRMSIEDEEWEGITFEEAYNQIKNRRPDMSKSTIKDWLEREGKKSKETIKKETKELEEETKRTQPDIDIKELIQSLYENGRTKKDIITEIGGDRDYSEADKKRATELVDEMISDESDKWLKKAQEEPDKYIVEKEGIAFRGFNLPWNKWAYKF